jgi:uncharacterized protein (DUF1501 family)
VNRREFLRIFALSSFACAYPEMGLLKGWAYSNGRDDVNSKKLVVILLRGGVDGLNVIAPYGDANYYTLRPTIALARPGTKYGAINLDNFFGMHPSLEPLMPFWRNKTLAFVHACGSPDPSRSHFDAQDYMESGVPGNKIINSGWLNRLVSQLPSKNSPVQAISFGPVLPRIFSGPYPIATVDRGEKGSQSPVDHPVMESAFREMYGTGDYLGKAFAEGMSAHKTIKSAMETPEPKLDAEQIAANRGAPLAKNAKGFGSQLANLFNKDASIQVAFTDLGGWDTHINQGAGSGQLANQLTSLSTGIADLIAGLGAQYRNTTILVMSEFGRTAKENGNGGTDHGHGNVMWLLGGDVPGGKVYSRWAGLAPAQLHESRDLPTSIDFRSVLISALSQHMQLSSAQLAKIFPDFSETAPAFKAT